LAYGHSCFLIIYVSWPFLSEVLISSLLASVAGIMVYISVDEILPMAHRSGHGHSVVLGIVLGMLIMALSLLMV
jgi:ZIP family zinc transporter